jgi:hypothetical protein
MYGRKESEGIDFYCDHAAFGMAHGSDPSRGIDELHYLATVYESGRVCMSQLHDQSHGRD